MQARSKVNKQNSLCVIECNILTSVIETKYLSFTSVYKLYLNFNEKRCQRVKQIWSGIEWLKHLISDSM